MDRTRIGLVLLSVTLLGTAGLYFYVGSIEAQDRQIGTIDDSDEGKLVRIEGVVNDVRYGNTTTRFELVDPDNGDIIDVFCSFKVSGPVKAHLVPGAGVVLVGNVAMYDDRPELVVDTGGDIEVVAYPASNVVRMAVIYQNKGSFVDMTVTVKGKVQGPRMSWGDMRFQLSDGANLANVTVKDFTPQVPFGQGSTVEVTGRAWFHDDGLLHISATGWGAVTVMG